MSGESNNIKYAVEPQFVDMGQQLFAKVVDRDLLITNQVWLGHPAELMLGLFFVV